MDTIIEYLQNASISIQALGVSAGGLVGVFATLGLFFVLIWGAGKISRKKE